MSEEILKALMQLFAIIAKQDGGSSMEQRQYVELFLKRLVAENTVEEFLALFDKYAKIKGKDDDKEESDGKERKRRRLDLTSVTDSVKTLGICKKINKTLTHGQKVVVLVRLFELINADQRFTAQRMEIINTVSEVFKISDEEYNNIEFFTKNDEVNVSERPDFLLISENKIAAEDGESKSIYSELLGGNVIILQIPSANLYFLRYTGDRDVLLNGLTVHTRRIYLFPSGSTIRPPSGKPIYYSDVVAKFLKVTSQVNLSFNIEHIEYKFPNGNIGVRDLSLSEEAGKLVGIMGASGAGKTTLLNVLSGIEKPSGGVMKVNGVDIVQHPDQIEGIFGFVPQDDLLIEELTVYENLYYNGKLCFKDLNDEELEDLVDRVLASLGLLKIKHLKVGSPMNKVISGGQRKRLNIALELIREPAILFLDEPTSGLSSRDSENVMDLLRELVLKGKLIFVVIHQPSSEIYKMFDKIVILDVGGHMIYYGHPVEAVTYFKRLDNQLQSEVGECVACGNVNTELVFNIIEAKVVDEFGQPSDERKVTPERWRNHFENEIELKHIPDETEPIPKTLKLPSWLSQWKIFTMRDFLSKISNTQYLVVNLMEAPALAFFLSFIVRYKENPFAEHYVYRENENIPAYIFMSIIVATFIGLTVSAEEIFRDRKIRKRERFLNLSQSSYLLSKVGILFTLSAIQTLMFAIIGNLTLGIKGMFFDYWLTLFSVSCAANMVGLNISSAFKTAVTIYILIPLLIIPQMVLSGAMFTFDKLNALIGGGHQVPFIAEFMPSRWAYEGMVVRQFKNNDYQKDLYSIEQKESYFDFKNAFYVPELIDINREIKEGILDSTMDQAMQKQQLVLLANELQKEMELNPDQQFRYMAMLEPGSFNEAVADSVDAFLQRLNLAYNFKFNLVYFKKELMVSKQQETKEKEEAYKALRDEYDNDYLSDLVKKAFAKHKVVRAEDHLVQVADPIFRDPLPSNPVNFRAHFYSPSKQLFGQYFDTFNFNMGMIWCMSLLFYVSLYFEWLRRFLDWVEKLDLFKSRAEDE